jgi:hypothetical protein
MYFQTFLIHNVFIHNKKLVKKYKHAYILTVSMCKVGQLFGNNISGEANGFFAYRYLIICYGSGEANRFFSYRYLSICYGLVVRKYSVIYILRYECSPCKNAMRRPTFVSIYFWSMVEIYKFTNFELILHYVSGCYVL